MRFDHIVIHVDNDIQKLLPLKEALNSSGYPFDPAQGNHNKELFVSKINIGCEYIELVRLLKPDVKTWMPLWTRAYEQGQRGAFCVFIEVEDVERMAVALKKSGIPARGPAVLIYPGLFGLLRSEAPYFIYYLPAFPGSSLQIALLQYKNASQREIFQADLQPNAKENGISGIRRVEIQLPNLDGSLEMIRKLFPELYADNSAWAVQLEKSRLVFSQSPDADSHLRLCTVTSQRANLGKQFQIENVELVTTGG